MSKEAIESTAGLDLIFDNSPSVLRNSMLALVMRITAWVLAIAFFGTGLALFFNLEMVWILDQFAIQANGPGLSDPARKAHLYSVSMKLSVVSFSASLLFFIIARLCKMIMRRNGFILNIFTWHENYKKLQRAKTN